MKKSIKRSIFPALSSHIPCKKSDQSKQRAATVLIDIDRVVLTSGIAMNSRTVMDVE